LKGLLLDALVLLTTTRFGRDYLRDKQVYRVVQRFDIPETDDDIKGKCEMVVDMLIRDEDCVEVTELHDEKKEKDSDDEDMVIEEIA
jgi:hypothetical protein